MDDYAGHEPYGGPAPFPDLMNDPAYETNHKGKERELEEPDTCRICRGEGTEDEQLFYPCKCSGSIKFVHQACLVEWLSHSQKKHCELCKTPFRFTKLYDPNMPQRVPTPLFAKQLLVHGFRTVITWLRFVLVAFVWLGWLPWSMRAIWRALFWLADGRWSGGDSPQQGSPQARLAQLVSNGTASMSAAVSSTSSMASASSAAAAAPGQSLQSPISSMFDFSSASGEPLILIVLKKAFWTLFFPAMSSTGVSSTGTGSPNMTSGATKQRRPSWLSDVKFLNTLTPSPTINNILIDTLEGQLITLLVVISFILIFLIREWVVQQQPMANIADGEREAAVQLIANNRPNNPPAPDEREPLFRGPEQRQGPRAREDPTRDGTTHEHVEDIAARQNAPMLDSRQRSRSDVGNSLAREDLGGPTRFRRHGGSDDETDYDIPGLEPLDRPGQASPGVEAFRDLWTRANGDPEHVRNIIREEGLRDDLGWIETEMTKLRGNDFASSSAGFEQRLSDTAHTHHFPGPQPLTSYEGANPTDFSPPLPATRPWDIERPSNPFARDTIPGQLEDRAASDYDPPVDRASGEQGEIEEPSVAVLPAHEGPSPAVNSTGADHGPDAGLGSSESGDHLAHPDAGIAAPPGNLATRAVDWFWADITPDRPSDDDSSDDGSAPEDHSDIAASDDEADNQAFAAELGVDANDLDALDEGDDMEGVLELIGMQGPIFGLLQNGVFSALIISFTVAIGIWLPYLWGKIALVLLANPIQLVFGVPMTAVSVIADITLDTLIGSLGYVMYSISLICKLLLRPFGTLIPLADWMPHTKSVTSASLSLIDASSHRLRNVVSAFFVFHESDVPMFSVLSHQALKLHEARIATVFRTVFMLGKLLLHDIPLQILSSGATGYLSSDHTIESVTSALTHARAQVSEFCGHLLHFATNTKWYGVGFTGAASTNVTIDYDLAVWDTKDRIIAIIMGYVLASALGLFYLRITGLFSGVERGQRAEGVVAEILHQSGGVMKVILIIGIEMIVFPLYCGSLLDVALLPLFDQASIASRLEFTSTAPLTSLFVHWFIGTCYMFHFALFVSMCRKILRSGVLYFIRDPDDPTFHPVRDVLERNITTQLRKIAFSALVYGALVIVCLGGVVWGLYYGFNGVLPIHWSATIPVLEFPVDLLFYNFVMPFAIRSIKPSDGLHSLYDWWFHKCARYLRLTSFFFGERQPDEEGHHVRRTWGDVLLRTKGDIQRPLAGPDHQRRAAELNIGTYFVPDGKLVRAPGSDQVRIPKGNPVFVPVSEDDQRLDGIRDQLWPGQFTKVYIPPHFRSRVAAFILLIWVFAAATGVGTTVIPMIIGRKIMSAYFPHRPLNDIYAFSTGICLVGSVAYLAVYRQSCFASVRAYLRPYLQSPRQALVGLVSAVVGVIRLAYVVGAFSILLPSVFALVMELYVLVPIHTYSSGVQAHVIHFVQDWTLGVLYVQMAIKFILWRSASRPATALRNIFRKGWIKPNAQLATRALLLPSMLLAIIAVVVPLVFGFAINSTVFVSSPDLHPKVYRYAYPVTLSMAVFIWMAYRAHHRVDTWRVNIRDEVYLIGERLHNFRDKRTAGMPRRVTTG